MHSRTFSTFLSTTLLFSMVAVTIAAIVSPPDPFTLVLYALPLSVVGAVAAYLLTYRTGDVSSRDRA
ncbi:DUF7534 family protein [Natronococcus occultus]|uniref:Uncharacterized protein n=1 Tax=Natronococcus occultus SP4 TaxID=694430 RepID=L0K714_9EURY|nr:hypothetical protein [Natronococcus occultus]AGB39918.1 hypothetical protein Natoc_4223 [Natronococcus occultus SP4]